MFWWGFHLFWGESIAYYKTSGLQKLTKNQKKYDLFRALLLRIINLHPEEYMADILPWSSSNAKLQGLGSFLSVILRHDTALIDPKKSYGKFDREALWKVLKTFVWEGSYWNEEVSECVRVEGELNER